MPWLMKCSLCGAPAGYQQQKWLNEIRAIYVNGYEWSFPALSGVGIRIHPEEDDLPRLPAHPPQRYDDANHNPAFDITMMNAHATSKHNMAGYLADPNDKPPWQSPWGTLFHDACWNVLVNACLPNEVDINVLHRFCVSCPMEFYLIDWGHDYGGIYDSLPEPNNPLDLQFPRLRNLKDTTRELYRANPVDIPELVQLLAMSIKPRGDSIPLQQVQPGRAMELLLRESSSASGYFSILPKEVTERILMILPSKDVVSFRISMKAIGSMNLSQTFWASRFTTGFEFEHIFEVQSVVTRPHYQDWEFLFNGLKDCASSFAFQNRKRLWNILRPFARVIQAISYSRCEGEPISTFDEPHLKPRIADCISLEAEIGPSEMRLMAGCKILFTRQICLGQITSVYVSSISFFDRDYIAGIRFLHANGVEVRLGHVIESREAFIDILGLAKMSDGLAGFILALSPRGINAISFVAASGRVSDWAGCYNGYPRRSLLLGGGPFHHIRADFDGFKMISLGILQSV